MGQQPPSLPARAKVDFAREIQPIFAKRCFACHGNDKSEGGLRLNKREPAFAELESGERAIVPGKVELSALVKRVSSTDEAERMPPEGKPLSPEQVDALRRWIAEGAKWEEHWAFRAPETAAIPPVKIAAWVTNPIDAFILARLEGRGLAPAGPAEKGALLRRATYDLTGLPPTPAEVEAFLSDSSPKAFETVIDRLLKSPRYGERWGRHWLDVVRYADTNSFERDGNKPHSWRYRDYVIRSFNADKPYSQFVLEQLAGDELPEVTNDSIIATGFHRLGLWDDEPADPLQAKFDVLDDVVATTAQVFLGLTVNCARCHDHKIDPIPQKDYYSLLAFFHGLTPNGTSGPNVERQLFTDEQSRKTYEEQAKALEERRNKAQAAVSAMEDEFRAKYEKTLAPGEQPPKNLAEVIKSQGAKILGEEKHREYGRLQARLEQLKKERAPGEYAMCVTEIGSQAPETFVLYRGNPHVPRAKVEPAFISILGGGAATIPAPVPDAKTSGRRLVLANWIASPENRLTARVMVNRIWQHHFGRGIVRSPNNFGQLGDAPTHPELLEWLATEFVNKGWRMKALHKTIMLSSAYRMSSRPERLALENDPANDLFSRFDMRRLSAEELRDSIHAVNGRLNLKMFGPGVYPEISTEVLAGQSMPGAGWGKSSPEEQARRSIYIHVKRSLITPLLADFDFADTDSSCAARFATTQPTQALGMLNGDFLNREAAEFARRLKREAGEEPQQQVALALRLALGREPDAASVERGLSMLKSLPAKHRVDANQALKYYCLLVYNLNEFVYLD